ncbi:MAG: hypothetical protein JSR48_03915 [Verrucomicrobia bacterium]|nr:hypothetical protein [Verrucomicrobiota bacterium]
MKTAPSSANAPDERGEWLFACAPDNDLLRVAAASTGRSFPRHDRADEAVAAARPGSAVLALADGYPRRPTSVAPETYARAAAKGVRLYVEFPAQLPGLTVGAVRRATEETVVVTADGLDPRLRPMQLLAVHDCHHVEVEAPAPLLVVAKVAGFDTAVFGLAGTTPRPILFEHGASGVLVATTKLSQFVTARYGPPGALQALWAFIFRWLQPEAEPPALAWVPTVRPTYSREALLPPDAARRAIRRGLDWHTTARMLLSADGAREYAALRASGRVDPANPVGPAPDGRWAAGNGRFGVLEGVNSRVAFDGTQPIRWNLRCDSNGESALAFALRWQLDGDDASRTVAGNLLDWVYGASGMFQTDPAKANFGLVHWAPDNGQALYQDNDVKVILGAIGTAAVLGTDRWDDAVVRNILANFRTTGRHGFRGWRLEAPELLAAGWEKYWRAETILCQPHYEAWMWAAYLWLYGQTGYRPLLERTRRGVRTMMEAYPDRWRWTNGLQQERGRMLLALAWLVRVEDRPEYRVWLERLADDLERAQDASGAIREELGELAQGDFRPCRSNEEYGTNEAPLIQENGDPVADLLYTCNFTLLGLIEAAAATGGARFARMADRLAAFLVRIQVRSEAHPELDGGWFRAFDFRAWDYFGSNGDAGWGAWAIEVGWTQGWIPTGLALRELRTSLWNLTRGRTVARNFDAIRREMLPDHVVNSAPGP